MSTSEKELELIEKTEGLVRCIAGKIAKFYEMDFDDLYQCGMIGLLNAIRKFDESYNIPFEKYAAMIIRGYVKSEMRKIARARQIKTMPSIKIGKDECSLSDVTPDYRNSRRIEEVDNKEIVDKILIHTLDMTPGRRAAIEAIMNDETMTTLADRLNVSHNRTQQQKTEALIMLRKLDWIQDANELL